MNTIIYRQELIQALRNAAKNDVVLESFLTAILTPSELEDIAKRLQIVKLLDAGMPQRDVAERLSVGIATVTRGARELKGSENGFHAVLRTRKGTSSWRENEARSPVRR